MCSSDLTKPHTNTTQQQSQATHKHNPATKPSHTHKHKPIHFSEPPIKNPGQATDQKPEQPIQKKSSQEQTHSKNIITRATEANPFKKIIIGANPFKKHHHRNHRANPFNKIITGAIGANPFKKMREIRE